MLTFGAVSLLLLIACLSVANLMLARLSERQRELIVRAALGSGRMRLVRQLLAEGFLLAMGGTGLGLAMALARFAGSAI
jgi:ABC-type antimicrobial peptide transport system permease subunit